MPGRVFLNRTITEMAAWLQAEVPDFATAPRFNISPGQQIVVCDPDRNLCEMRWGIIPVGRVNARGRPVMKAIINARSETLFEKSAFAGTHRCLVAVDGWYEWTGERRRKAVWRIQAADGNLLVFAAIFDIWTAPDGSQLAQVAIVTCPPSNDVRDIHHRMGVILHRSDVSTWLGEDTSRAAQLMVPLTAGKLVVEPAVGVDWTAP